jgi:LPS sulfotransferase NodH
VTPPLLVLGVRRSGTTLLRVMLDRNSELAVPDESYFVPQLAQRHREHPDPYAFLDDVRRLPTIREWEIDVDELRGRLRQGMTLGEMIGAIYETYAAARGKERWGDKTPLYMQYLPLLERLFQDACYVHLIRDGRDTAQSFLSMPRGIVTESWSHPRDIADFACQWRTEVEAARALGGRVGDRYREVRYESLAADPEETLHAICDFAGLPYEPAMLDYAGEVDVSRKPHQQSLTQRPTAGLRDWRTTMDDADVRAFEEIAGGLLTELGYEVRHRGATPARARLRLARYRVLGAGWRATAAVLQRSPLWKRRHPLLV